MFTDQAYVNSTTLFAWWFFIIRFVRRNFNLNWLFILFRNFIDCFYHGLTSTSNYSTISKLTFDNFTTKTANFSFLSDFHTQLTLRHAFSIILSSIDFLLFINQCADNLLFFTTHFTVC